MYTVCIYRYELQPFGIEEFTWTSNMGVPVFELPLPPAQHCARNPQPCSHSRHPCGPQWSMELH